ncbi:MAG: hypothetical protein J1E43_05530 [Christensenellaceae bacterium]|nr:hypothetical protein [Christensenellaceae bacterium]
MKKLRQDLDFTKTYGSVPASFEERVMKTLRDTAPTEQPAETVPVRRRPYLRIVIVVAVLLALTATAVAAMLSRTAEMYLGPHGLGGSDSQIAVDMQNGSVAYAGQSMQLGNVLFTLDDAVWGEEDIYATGTYQVVGDTNELLVGFGLLPSHAYSPFGTDREDTTMTYLEYAEANSLQLIGAEIFMKGYLDANGEGVSGDSSFYSYEESEGVHRFGLMLFLTPEKMQAAREAGSRFQFTLTVYQYDESGRPTDPDDTDIWNATSWISDEWEVSLPGEN